MSFCVLGRMPYQLSLLLAVLSLPGLQSASHRRNNLRLPASASSLIDSAQGVTTTAVSVWPAEGAAAGVVAGAPTTTAAPKQAAVAPIVVPGAAPNVVPGAAPNVAPGAAPNVVPGAAPNAVPLPTMGPVVLPKGAGAPPGSPPASVGGAAVPAKYAAPEMIVNASSPCQQINLTETLKQVQNAAHLSAQAAQAALDHLGHGGPKPSLEATTAYGTAVQAAGNWEHLLNSAGRTERTADAIDYAVKVYGKVGRKAANNYHQAVMNVRDFPPHIPAVQLEKHLGGISRT